MTPDCIRCARELREKLAAKGQPPGWNDLRFTRMFLCPECGNKRCPKATDHRLNCTGSNEPGQEGSEYQ